MKHTIKLTDFTLPPRNEDEDLFFMTRAVLASISSLIRHIAEEVVDLPLNQMKSDWEYSRDGGCEIAYVLVAPENPPADWAEKAAAVEARFRGRCTNDK